jgi:crotonobetainyl-CoA:carnitine CoA-transferase CaiB-like acyl-CoA transferase
MPGPLEGIRVADLTRGIAGPHTTKLLADYGATVTKVEPPEGDPARHWGPYKSDLLNPEASAPFLFLNTNKRGVVADLRREEGREAVRRLIAASDVVVEDYAPGELARLGIDLDALRAARPALVVCSITPFGQTGPYAAFVATDIVLQAMGGAMHATGHAAREPLRLGGSFAEWHAGLAGALAVLMAVERAETTGRGEHIDLSIYETQAGGKDRRQLALVAHAYSGLITRRHETAFAICSGARPCKDGFINLLGNGPRLPAVLRMIGRADLLDRPELRGPEECIPADLVEEIETSYLAWTMEHTMREAVAIAQAHRILGGSVHTIADVLADPVFRERGVWEMVDHPATGPVEYPSRPFILSGSPRPPMRRAPLLGEHDAGDGGWGMGVGGGGLSSGRDAGQSPRAALPLTGVRVIDLTVVWAGPFATQLLAEWGAEVIRVEPITAVQPQTRGVERARYLTRELVERGVANGSLAMGYPHRDPGPDPWNRNPLFNASSSNKLSCTGNVLTPAVREAFMRLVAVSDVLVENNVPSTIEKLGITYETLCEVNPGLIMVRMPGFGLSGAYADYRCWGNHLEAMAGHHIVRSYPDMTLDAAGETYACDSVAGLTAAVATMMALRHRRRTGRGQQVEVPQIEAFMQMMGVEILDYTMNGRVAGPMGNDHHTHAPHGVYPCRPDPLTPFPAREGETAGSTRRGEPTVGIPFAGITGTPQTSEGAPQTLKELGERWIAIDVGDEAQWQALCRVLGAAELAADPRFVDMAGRWAHRRELDAALARFIRDRDRMDLFQALQAAGVPAGPVQDEADCFACPQLAARGFFQEQTRDDIGTFRYPGMLFRWADTPNRHRRPPVTLGQDNEYVYRNLLGLSADSYQALLDAGEVGTTYPRRLIEGT